MPGNMGLCTSRVSHLRQTGCRHGLPHPAELLIRQCDGYRLRRVLLRQHAAARRYDLLAADAGGHTSQHQQVLQVVHRGLQRLGVSQINADIPEDGKRPVVALLCQLLHRRQFFRRGQGITQWDAGGGCQLVHRIL